MKTGLGKVLLISVLTSMAPIPAQAFENLSSVLSSEQQACFSMAMIGMDSVINARLGVPPEHALDLARNPANLTAQVGGYDSKSLNVILDAYLWEDTPHSYAIKTFYNCAATSMYKHQVKAD